jgi:hypothetical protein
VERGRVEKGGEERVDLRRERRWEKEKKNPRQEKPTRVPP